MRLHAAVVLMLVCLCLAIQAAYGCNSSPNEAANTNEADEDYEDEASSDSELEDEEDETVEDVALDEEDFDLICSQTEVTVRSQGTPDVIIIGAKKGGTRALIEFLKLHPLLKAAGPEIHFFDNNYEKGLDWYISQLPPVADNQLRMEKTPGYFHTPKVPRRIKAMDPNVKLLLIIRDPVKRLISDYNQFRTKNLDSGGTYPDLEDLAFTPSGEINVRYPALQRSIYHEHMARWLKHFPPEQILVINGDSFIKRPWIEVNKIEDFLHVPSVVTEDNFFFNNTKGFYCGREIRTKGVWSCSKEKCLSKAKGRPKPPLKDGTVEKLVEFFKPHNALFYEMMNETFGWPT